MGERINPFKQFSGVFIPEWLLERRECSIMAKVLYALLAFRAGRKGCCWPSQLWIANRLGVTDRQVRNYLAELTDLRLIEIQQRGRTAGGRGRSALYWFLKHRWFEGSAKYARQAISGHNALPGNPTSGQKPAALRGTRARLVEDTYRGKDSRRSAADVNGRSQRDRENRKPGPRELAAARDVAALAASLGSAKRIAPLTGKAPGAEENDW